VQVIFPGEYELWLRLAKVGRSFPLDVTAQGVSLGESSIQPTGPSDTPASRRGGADWFHNTVRGFGRSGWVWKQVGLGKVVVTGTIQDCLVTMKNVNCDLLKAEWALDFLELRRTVVGGLPSAPIQAIAGRPGSRLKAILM
jgi:hypothetical protein